MFVKNLSEELKRSIFADCSYGTDYPFNSDNEAVRIVLLIDKLIYNKLIRDFISKDEHCLFYKENGLIDEVYASLNPTLYISEVSQVISDIRVFCKGWDIEAVTCLVMYHVNRFFEFVRHLDLDSKKQYDFNVGIIFPLKQN